MVMPDILASGNSGISMWMLGSTRGRFAGICAPSARVAANPLMQQLLSTLKRIMQRCRREDSQPECYTQATGHGQPERSGEAGAFDWGAFARTHVQVHDHPQIVVGRQRAVE